MILLTRPKTEKARGDPHRRAPDGEQSRGCQPASYPHSSIITTLPAREQSRGCQPASYPHSGIIAVLDGEQSRGCQPASYPHSGIITVLLVREQSRGCQPASYPHSGRGNSQSKAKVFPALITRPGTAVQAPLSSPHPSCEFAGSFG